MTFSLTRAPTSVDLAAGLFRAEHFQVAYATNDIARARAIFTERYGVKEFRTLEGPLRAGGSIRVELAWVGAVMYELLTAAGAGSEIYMSRVPTDVFSIKHHHLGYLIQNAVQWDTLMTSVRDQNWSMPHTSENTGFMKSCFVDAPELGHYLEYIFPEQAGFDFFESVPRC